MADAVVAARIPRWLSDEIDAQRGDTPRSTWLADLLHHHIAAPKPETVHNIPTRSRAQAVVDHRLPGVF